MYVNDVEKSKVNGFDKLWEIVSGNKQGDISIFKSKIWVVTQTLTPRQKEALCLRFGLGAMDTGKVLKQKEVSNIMGASQPCVSKLINIGIKRLKHKSRRRKLGL